MRELRHALRLLGWRPVTLLILSPDASRSWRLRVPGAVAAGLVAAWLGTFAVAALVAGRHVHYEAMRLLNGHLAARADGFARDLARAEELARRLAPLEADLRKTLGRTRREAETGGGSGGPQPDFLPGEIPGRVAKLERVSEGLFREYRNLSTLAAATPSGWPVRGWLSSEYGERVSPYTGEVGSVHQGVDIAQKLGAPIRATADGLVLFAAWTPGGYGKMIEIAHGYGYATRYGHCSRLRATAGQRVSRGDVIAYVGSTGNATGPHLHYEVRLYGVPVNPRSFLR